MSSLISGLVLLAVISVFLMQFTLLLLFMVVSFIISVVSYPAVRKHVAHEADKQRQETNVTEPLKARDLCSWKGWYKLAFKWGIPKTMCLHIGVYLGIIIPVFFGLYLTGLNLLSAYISTAIVMVIFTVQFYRQIKKNHLKPHGNTEHTPLTESPA